MNKKQMFDNLKFKFYLASGIFLIGVIIHIYHYFTFGCFYNNDIMFISIMGFNILMVFGMFETLIEMLKGDD